LTPICDAKGGLVLTLQISQSAIGAGVHRIEARLTGTGAPQLAVSEFPFVVSAEDRERVRWYLEDFLEYPLDPSPQVAEGVEARLAALGRELFDGVFASVDGQRLWARLQDRLPETRVEVASEVGDATALPWELLCDPLSGESLALQAASFVRVNHTPARPARLSEPGGGTLRVLLVICRPAGRADVPFRSVASHLVRLGGQVREVLDLNVLRPPTFAGLTAALEAAARAGRPYHVVHFDGHGTYLDAGADQPSGGGTSQHRYAGLNFVSPPRSGGHGYLLFEDSTNVDNSQLVEGPILGALLARTGVSVLVLNACRSAYAEAPTRPVAAEAADVDVHRRVRAYGSLALEVTDAGVPGVVAMRYSVYVVTAAQFVADLYASLLAGHSLGAAVSTGRRQLAAQPNRTIAFEPRPLQDWSVPVVYEAAPVTLFTPGGQGQIHIQVAEPGAQPARQDDRLPARPDVGFFGRDETLLALDRAFDRHRIVLLHAFAGSGKTSTAVEFAGWYRSTGGLADSRVGDGVLLFSSLEQHKPLAVLLNEFADVFDPVLTRSGVAWQALDDRQRRDVAVQVLAQVPVLWIWDNVEPVAGFPAGTTSAWTDAEQAELLSFLRELADRTRARVLLTSRRDEQAWLGDLPARVELPPMPMREAIQLTQALGAGRGHRITDVKDWRPLLRYAAGNPLAVTVLVGQALRERLTSREQIEAFVARLRAGEANLDDDVRQGRSKSLAASLGYGFANAFTEAERAQLAVLHLFQETVDVDVLAAMGHPDSGASVSQLHGLTRQTGIALLDRAAGIGLLTPLVGGYYRIHPALPWYFSQLYAATYPTTTDAAGQTTALQVTHAYTSAVGALGSYYQRQYISGHHQVVAALGVEEANLLHARTLARRYDRWRDVMGCMQGLRDLYAHTGRRAHWSRLVDDLVPDLVDPDTGGPLPGREDHWSVFTGYRVDLAYEAREWTTAQRLQTARVTWNRDRAADALATHPDRYSGDNRHRIRNLAVSLETLGHVQREERLPDCVATYQEAVDLYRRINARTEESTTAFNLGHAHLNVPQLRDLDQAEHWYRRALDLTAEHDDVRRARRVAQLGDVARERFLDAHRAGASTDVLVRHLNDATDAYHQSFDLTPIDQVIDRAITHNQLGVVYAYGGRLDTALHHYRQAIRTYEDAGDRYHAGQVRYNVARALAAAGQPDQALLYAHAALRDYEPYGASAAADVDDTRKLIAAIERRDFNPTD
jgi:tetratricopeptide (TPR) repeat protein